MLVKCQFCLQQVDKKEAVRSNEKNYHADCLIKFEERKKLYDTVARVLNLKAPGPKNIMLINKYFNSGYTYEGMINALEYFYDIKKNSTLGADERIGIIPYIYVEAQQYMEELNKQKEKIISGINQRLEENGTINETYTIKINTNKPNKRKERILELSEDIFNEK